MVKNIWDNLAEGFNTNLELDQLSTGLADNILIAWPALLDFVQQQFEPTTGKRALDFGCGTGGFAKRLAQLGFITTGYDNSAEMIKVADKYNNSDNPQFTSDLKTIAAVNNNIYDLITAVMVLQFFEDNNAQFAQLLKLLDTGGLLLFDVFNQKYVQRCLELGIAFGGFANPDKPEHGYIDFGRQNKVPINIRSAADYDRIFQKLGFKKVLESYPEFTEEFKQKYPKEKPVDVPEYMILGYKHA